MKFRGPDHAVIAAWNTMREASVAKAIDLSATEGLWHAKKCRNPKCGGRVYVEAESRYGGVIERCKRCGTPWNAKPVCLSKGLIKTSGKTTRGTGPIVRSGELQELVSRVPSQTLRVYACWLISGRGYAWTAKQAARHDWPGGPWDENAVRRAIRRGRKWLRAELEAADLLVTAA